MAVEPLAARSSKLDVYMWSLLIFKTQHFFFFFKLCRPDKTAQGLDQTFELPVYCLVTNLQLNGQTRHWLPGYSLQCPFLHGDPSQCIRNSQVRPRGWNRLTRWPGMPKMAVGTYPLVWGLQAGFEPSLHLQLVLFGCLPFGKQMAGGYVYILLV